jgi:ABC-type polysaccharide/polyol phosphate transport system ATPase subunit
MEALRQLCTRGIWIEHGRLVEDGPIGEIIDRYLEAVAARAAPVAQPA